MNGEHVTLVGESVEVESVEVESVEIKAEAELCSCGIVGCSYRDGPYLELSTLG